jgi:hypothetical protein
MSGSVLRALRTLWMGLVILSCLPFVVFVVLYLALYELSKLYAADVSRVLLWSIEKVEKHATK